MMRSFAVFVLAALITVAVFSTRTSASIAIARPVVATSATVLYTSPNWQMSVLIRNPSAVSVYIGGSDVTTSTGFEVAAGDAISYILDPLDSIYGVVAASTQTMHILAARVAP